MGVIDKIFGKIGLTDTSDGYDADTDDEPESAPAPPPKTQNRSERGTSMSFDSDDAARNVVNFHAERQSREGGTAVPAKMKVIVIEPKSFDDAQQVANNLREKKPVVINFENTDAEAAKRIIDFISGTTYALDGEIKKVGHNVFLCAPSNVNVSYTEDARRVSVEMPWLNKQ